jgi:translocator protein
MTSPPKYPALIGWLALCFSASLGAFFVSTDGWYAGLVKPSWSPPSWLFGPVWTVLYVLMAVSAWLIWRSEGWRLQKLPLSLFLVQLALNALWTPLFFGLHNSGLAFAEIVLLWIALTGTFLLFCRVQRLAGALLFPYLLWVSFAAALNFSLWRLNNF